MITFSSKGDFRKTFSFLEKAKEAARIGDLNKYGEMGVEILRKATPEESGLTSDSWYYEIERKPGKVAIHWCNSNLDKEGTPIAILLQYGHGTRNGGYVEGIDYINPSIKPLFERMTEEMWKEVTQS